MKYKIKFDSELEPSVVAGTIVYRLVNYDYGTASDDSRITGIPHVSVTLKEDGTIRVSPFQFRI